jgi:Rad3-related DNA helicase
MESKEPTIFVSPSSTEGLDLKNDLSRFQIICKIDYPYLGDKLVKKRMEKYKYWYSYQAVKSLIQAKGRSVRNEEDYAITYILDSNFDRLYDQNNYLFPESFKKALQ